jgi:hypothetical protein
MAFLALHEFRHVKIRAGIAKSHAARVGEQGHACPMDNTLVQSLHGRLPHLRARWQELLRATPASSAMANPDLLDHLLDPTLEEVFRVLREPPAPAVEARARAFESIREACVCGRNPLLDFFTAGEQALIEALMVAQAGTPAPAFAARSTAVAELYLAVRTISRQEVGAFCSLCQHRAGPPSAAKPTGPALSEAVR